MPAVQSQSGLPLKLMFILFLILSNFTFKYLGNNHSTSEELLNQEQNYLWKIYQQVMENNDKETETHTTIFQSATPTR